MSRAVVPVEEVVLCRIMEAEKDRYPTKNAA